MNFQFLPDMGKPPLAFGDREVEKPCSGQCGTRIRTKSRHQRVYCKACKSKLVERQAVKKYARQKQRRLEAKS